MTRNCRNRRPQANPWHDKEDPPEHRQSKEEIDTVKYHTWPLPTHTHTQTEVYNELTDLFLSVIIMRGSSKFCQRGLNSYYVFLVDEGKEDPNTTKSWPSSTRQRNAIVMAFPLRADDGPTLNAGSVTL